jgi:hypothetical protein
MLLYSPILMQDFCYICSAEDEEEDNDELTVHQKYYAKRKSDPE